jgi:hypothetical protein
MRTTARTSSQNLSVLRRPDKERNAPISPLGSKEGSETLEMSNEGRRRGFYWKAKGDALDGYGGILLDHRSQRALPNPKIHLLLTGRRNQRSARSAQQQQQQVPVDDHVTDT